MTQLSKINDWNPVHDNYGEHVWPPRGVVLEFMRDEWDSPVECKWEDVLPEANIIGLYWRMK